MWRSRQPGLRGAVLLRLRRLGRNHRGFEEGQQQQQGRRTETKKLIRKGKGCVKLTVGV